MPFSARQLPSGRWQGGFRHPVTRRPVTQTFDYSYEADAWAIEAERAAKAAAIEGRLEVPTSSSSRPQLAEPPAPSRWIGPTLEAFGRAYLDRRRGSLQRATLAKYEAHLAGLGRPLEGSEAPPPATVPMGLLGRDAVQQWITDSVAAGVGAPSINGRLRLIRQLFAELLEQDDPPAGLRNPTRGLAFLPEDQEPDRVLTPAEEAALLKVCDPQLRAAVLVALYAGLRWQEVYGLRASAVQGSSYLVVSHVIERGSSELRAFTKGKRIRTVPMPESLAEELEPIVAAARRRGGPEALLFPALGRPDRPGSVAPDTLWTYENHRKRKWLPALAEIGEARLEWRDTGRVRKSDGAPIMQRRILEPAFGFHALRHTYGSRLAAAGVPRHEIAELMGHANERTTGRYIHAGDDGRRLALVRGALPSSPRIGAA